MRTIIINKNTYFGALTLFLLAAPRVAVSATYHYEISVDESLQKMTVEARFESRVSRIDARADHAGDVIENAFDCDTGERLRVRSTRLRLPRGGIRCLQYTVDLDAANRRERISAILHPDNVAASPRAWLWRPALYDGDTLTARFVLADGHRVYVPWKRITDNEYELTTSPRSGSATALFGKFETAIASVGGANLRIVLPKTRNKIEFAPLVQWLRDTAESIASVYGRFPNPDASIVLIPIGESSWSNSAIPFGRVIRDGGETIELLVNENVSIDEFYGDWTATHELSHLFHPYLEREHRWISEGFAQYYQNILMARTGHYSDSKAWWEIVAGLERGRESVPHLSPNRAAASRESGTRMKYYWAGAAIALLADVELRQKTDHRLSLDVALGRLQACCLPANRKWSGPEFFTQLDELTETSVFMDLYRQHATRVGFPSTRETLRNLGVTDASGRVNLDDAAPWAGIRQRIIAPVEEQR
ncbi:MAG: hypothetical protein AAF351_14960 [Pseudomonadota bacterium]